MMDGFFSFSKSGVSGSQAMETFAPDCIEIQLARTSKIRQDAYKLRHDAYLSYNFIHEDPSGLFEDAYDSRENVRLLTAYKNGRPAGTVRVCLFDPTGAFPEADKVPAMEIFGDEIRALTAPGQGQEGYRRAVEVGRLARSPEFANDKAVIHTLFRAVGYLVLFFRADIVLNACRPHHVPIYRRFGFDKLEEPKLYPGLTFAAGLMACHAERYDNARAKLAFLRGISKQDQDYFELMSGERTSFSSLAPARGLNAQLPAGLVDQGQILGRA
jgi:hypothetical protein